MTEKVEAGYCTRCPKRDECESVCGDIEAYVNQDFKGHGQVISFDAVNDVADSREHIRLSDMEYRIARLLDAHISRANICEVLGISRKTLRDYIFALKKKSNKLDAFCTVRASRDLS